MIGTLKSLYRREQFFPSFPFGLFLNPFYHARRNLCSAVKNTAPRLEGKLVDIGCGTKPYESLFNVSTYEGIEVEDPTSPGSSKADHSYDGKTFPFQDSSYDSAFCSQVLEHVFEPEDFLKEVHRILKPGGQLLLTIPFVWDEHEQPRDYARYTSFGLKHLLEKNGFSLVEAQKTCTDSRVLFQLMNAYLYKCLIGPVKPLNWLFTVILMGPVNLAGVIAGILLPKNKDLYLDQVVLARRD